jgi:sodium-dependent dicarboxylate transporter 2/3/5
VEGMTERHSEAEERFNRRRATVGLFMGPLLFFALLAWPAPGLSPEAHRLSAIMALVVVFWITEALPIPITALLGPVLAVLLRVAPVREAFASFADPIIFLFIGSFILAEAMFVHGLDRRIAFTALSFKSVGRSPTRVLAVFGGVSAGLSMWISNTATTAMMFPIGMAIIAHLRENQPDSRAVDRFALAMMLVTAFGASIGGIGTPVGTPPNLIGLGVLERTAGIKINFFNWMVVGVPLVILMFAAMVVYFDLFAIRGRHLHTDSAELAATELRKMGRLSRAQKNVLVAFFATVALWLAPGVLAVAGLGETAFARAFNAAVPESVAAVSGALLLFLLPVDWTKRQFTVSWQEASRIEWGIILLFGGGLALGGLAFSTGLAETAGKGLLEWVPARSPVAFTMLFTAVAIVMTEASSNTAAANMVVPIAIAVSQAAGISPLEPALGATLGCSMAFMLPISTPPNAIVYSSGHVPITAMVRHGVVIDAIAFVLIVTVVMLLGGLVA